MKIQNAITGNNTASEAALHNPVLSSYTAQCKLLITVLISFIVFISGFKAMAQSPTAPAQGFNVFVKNNAAFYTSQTEGAIAIGGDLTIGGSYGVATQNNFYYQSNGLNLGLLVAGKVNYNNGTLQVLNNGYVLIGNQNGSKAWYLDNNNSASPIRITPTSDYNAQNMIMLQTTSPALNVSATKNPIFQTNPIDFAAAFTTMQSNSTIISGYTDNTVIYTSPNQNSPEVAHTGIPSNSQIYIKNLAAGTNVLNITGDDLNKIAIFGFNQQPDASHVLVFNVNTSATGGVFNWNAFQTGSISGSNAPYIIYNFYNSKQLNITNGAVVEGTVFAPFADISKSNNNNSNIEGQVIGLSYAQTAGGTIRSFNFTPTINALVTKPTLGASAAIFSNPGINSATFSCTPGNGANRLIIVSSNAVLSANPTDNKQYAANTSLGKGDAIGNGYTVYNGSGNSVTVSNLTANTKYYFTVIEYNGTGSTLSYATSVAYSASVTTLADTDGDGVADIYDAYPADRNKAFNNYFPANGFGTLMYEDQWPSKGDYDFNDIVVDYRYNIVTNAANNVVEANYSFLPRAAGCIYKNGFAFQLDGVSTDKITTVTGTKAAWVTVNSNGTEAGQTNNNANILVTDNFFNLFTGRSGNDMVNTVPGIAKLNADTVSVSVKFLVNGVVPTGGTVSFTNFGSNVFNPYIIVSQMRGQEIHLADSIPSSKMDIKLFGTADDKSVPSKGTYYRTANNLPWALNIVSSVPYPTETTDITTAYLNLIKWAVSGGSLNTDWYLPLSGYRDNTKIYSK